MADRPIQFRQWQRPKRGEGAEVCEDAAAGDASRGCFAIADGASESADAGRWARLLVEEYVRAPAVQLRHWTIHLAALQQRWTQEANAPEGRPWYAEVKRQQGAFATFLGLMFEETRWLGRKRWQALAVGDSCLFQVRNGRFMQAWPVARADDFGSTPWLVGSSDKPRIDKSLSHSGNWCDEDRFWLMTDALAQWFLRETEAGGKPWETLDQLRMLPDAAFATWIEQQRDAQKLRNDDVTLLAVYW